MNILILGGTYFIGRVLIELLLFNKKHSITLLNRGTREQYIGDLPLIRADRSNYVEVKSALKGKSFDIILDMSGYNKNDISIMLDCLNYDVTQYIFCSSIAVCSQPPLSWPITEEHEKCSSIQENSYGYDKWMAEQFLFNQSRKSNLVVSVVRPVYVYGPYDYSGRLDYFFQRISKGLPVTINGNGDNIIQFGYVYDLCNAIISLIRNKNAYGQVFNISGKELVTVNQLIKLISLELGVDANVKFNYGKCDSEISTLTSENRFAGISKAEEIINIIPETDLSEGIHKTLKWWRSNQ